MSYAPIYAKLRDLEERLAIVERIPKTIDIGNTISSFSLKSDTSDSAAEILDELNQFKTNFANLLNECNPLSARVGKLSEELATLATKEELATLATKEELVLTLLNSHAHLATKAEIPDVSGFATKAELPDVSGFATKDEVADLLLKFDNLINVVSQLNLKLNEVNEKKSVLESS
jgi:hypothetical protein